MTTPEPGDPFHLDLDGTVIAGHYFEVDTPHRLVIEWDRETTGDGRPALIEFIFTPTDDQTTVEVRLSGLSAEDADLYSQLVERYLNKIKAAFGGRVPARTALGVRDGQ